MLPKKQKQMTKKKGSEMAVLEQSDQAIPLETRHPNRRTKRHSKKKLMSSLYTLTIVLLRPCCGPLEMLWTQLNEEFSPQG